MKVELDLILFITIIFLSFTFLTLLIRFKLASVELSFGHNIRVRSFMGFFHRFVGGAMIVMCLASWYLVNEAASKERQHLDTMYSNIAKNFAYNLREMGHGQIDLNTKQSEQKYLGLINTMINWIELDPKIISIYSLRKGANNENYFVVAPETDYDNNGKINGEDEARVPIGEVYPERIPELEEAFLGNESLQNKPNLDEWGYSISVFAPIYSTSGRVEAVLGIDFDGYSWERQLKSARLKIMLFLLIPFTLLFISYWILYRMRVQEIKNLSHIVHHDILTGLPNRLLFEEHLSRALIEAKNNHSSVGVMFLDLDNFKEVNDIFGHNVGDNLLKAVTTRLQNELQDKITLARWGGDEFTLLVTRISNDQSVCSIAQKICDSFKKPFIIEGHELYITSSIGVSLYPDNGTEIENLIKYADIAMYKAKQAGKNNYLPFAQTMNTDSFNRLALENDLRKALVKKEFVIYYQPQVKIETGEIIGAEALVRWQHPVKGLISPCEFIPIAEETRLVLPLDILVLQMACKQNVVWQKAGLPRFPVSVNLSPYHFQGTTLVSTLKNILETTGLQPEYLEIEITETLAMNSGDEAIESLKELKNLGIKIAMDDFGTGYSALSQLQNMPIDRLKIDKTFIKNVMLNPNDRAIVSAIMTMADALKFELVAEGVETQDQLNFLRNKSCTIVQGFLFSPPVSAKEFEKLLLQTESQVY